MLGGSVVYLLRCIQLLQPHGLYSPPGSSVHGISQARFLEWIAISFSRRLPNPGIELMSPAFQVVSLPAEPPWLPKGRC